MWQELVVIRVCPNWGYSQALAYSPLLSSLLACPACPAMSCSGCAVVCGQKHHSVAAEQCHAHILAVLYGGYVTLGK